MANARILVIEDDEDISFLILKILHDDAGYEIERATSFEDAASRLGRGGYDLVMLDHRLWGSHFDEELWASLPPHVPVIFCTAEHDCVNHVLPDRPYDILKKPFDLGDLLRMVARLLAQSAPQPATATP